MELARNETRTFRYLSTLVTWCKISLKAQEYWFLGDCCYTVALVWVKTNEVAGLVVGHGNLKN